MRKTLSMAIQKKRLGGLLGRALVSRRLRGSHIYMASEELLTDLRSLH